MSLTLLCRVPREYKKGGFPHSTKWVAEEDTV